MKFNSPLKGYNMAEKEKKRYVTQAINDEILEKITNLPYSRFDLFYSVFR